MECRLKRKSIKEIHPTNVLPQTSTWGKIKRDHGLNPLGFEMTISEDLLFARGDTLTKTADDLLVLLVPIGADLFYAYVPYGPKIEPDPDQQGLFLEELSETMRPHLPQGCLFIRYDLMWQNLWAEEDTYFDSSGNWIGPPPDRTQELRFNFNTRLWNLKKSPEDILPKDTFFLDVTKSERALLSEMRYNTRYSIRKSSNTGLSIKNYGKEGLNLWYPLYLETATRHGLPKMSPAYFASFFNNQDNERNGVKVQLLMADHDGDLLAGMFFVLSRKRGTYLYGASSSKKRDKLASYALQWKAIKIAKQSGCSEYDLFGSAPNLSKRHPLYGITIFKKGFGGELFHRMGCWDYPFNHEEYKGFRISEIQNHTAT